MTNFELIEKLSNAKGVPGFEGEVVAIVREFAEGFATVEVDSMLNVYLYPKGHHPKEHNPKETAPHQPQAPQKPVVTLDAHSDEVGLMVQSIHENGLIEVVAIGGWSPSNLQAQLFHIRTKGGGYVQAVTSSIPPHFLGKGGKGSALQIKDIRLDVGASSRQEVEASFGISIGSPIIPATTFYRNKVNNTFMGKALDNRLGCAVVLLSCKALFAKADTLDVLPVGVISTQEELGLRGARISSRRVNPRAAIVLEASPSDELTAPSGLAQGVLGKGTQVRAFDPTMLAHPGLVQFICRVGDDAGVKYQLAVRNGGGTNGGVLHLQGAGVPTVVVAVPSRYIHSHNAIASMDDFDATLQLVVATVEQMTSTTLDSLHNGTYAEGV